MRNSVIRNVGFVGFLAWITFLHFTGTERYMNAGRRSFRAGNFEEALTCFNALLEKDESSAMGWYWRGATRYERGDYDGAIKDIDHALTLGIPRSEEADAFSWRASSHWKLGNRPQAELDYTRAINLVPIETDWLLCRAEVRFEMDDFDGVLRDTRRVLKVDAKSKLARRWSSAARFELGQVQQAIDEQSRAISHSPEAVDFLRRGEMYYEVRDYQRAHADVERALEMAPDDDEYLDALKWRAALYDEMEDRDRELTDRTQIIELEPAEAENWFARGCVYYQRKQYGRAVADFSRGLELQPDCAKMLRWRAAAYQCLGEIKSRPCPNSHFVSPSP